MDRGVLINATRGTTRYPTSSGVAGGMTYRPPTPKRCPMPTRHGAPCKGEPTVSGLCMGHARTVAPVVAALVVHRG